MFDSGSEKTFLLTALGLWFAHGWYLNDRLKSVHKKLDLVLENFTGLTDYLYEIDPQFEDERQSRKAFEAGESDLACENDMELVRRKKQQGKRTLNTPLVS